MLKLEAVTVCIDYADFLRETAHYNAHLFDRWLIVTSPTDSETRELCRRLNLECLATTDGGRGGSFAKGRLIERGLQHLSAEGWRLQLDVDVALPLRTRQALAAASLQEDCIYGIDRLMCKSWDDWQAVQAGGYLRDQHDYHSRLRWPALTHTEPAANGGSLEIGTRWVHPREGYVPIGFFQMWHSSQDEWRGVKIKPYPISHGKACRTDVQHGLQFDRHKRVLLPEIIGVHLESQPAKMGANWTGRTTRRFGPGVSPTRQQGTGAVSPTRQQGTEDVSPTRQQGTEDVSPPRQQGTERSEVDEPASLRSASSLARPTNSAPLAPTNDEADPPDASEIF